MRSDVGLGLFQRGLSTGYSWPPQEDNKNHVKITLIRRGAPSSTSGGFQFATQDRHSGIISELSPPLLFWVWLVFDTLVCSRGVSSWISPFSVELFPPFLSLFRFLLASLVCGGGGGIRVGGLGTIGNLGVVVPAWDSSKESRTSILFSSTNALGTSVVSWFSLTRVVVNLELDAMSLVSFGQ